MKNNLTIIQHPDPLLSSKCEEIKEITEELQVLAEDMMEIMKNKNGIGLAAPQIGRTIRLIVMHVSNCIPKKMFNPKVQFLGKLRRSTDEQCLSFPNDKKVSVKRPQEVWVTFKNEKGNHVFEKLHGLEAVVFLHELDHLNGKTLADYEEKK